MGAERSAAFAAKSRALEAGRSLLDRLDVTPNGAARAGLHVNQDGRRRTAFELLSYPGIDLQAVKRIWPEIERIPPSIGAQLETDARYAVYLARQEADIAAYRKDEAAAIPRGFDYGRIAGLSTEIRQKLEARRPATLAHASRIDGITPAALMLLAAHVKKVSARKSA